MLWGWEGVLCRRALSEFGCLFARTLILLVVDMTLQ
jgi:hypothetical protein